MEATRDELLDQLVAVTRARDTLAETADRLLRERDEQRAENRRLHIQIQQWADRLEGVR